MERILSVNAVVESDELPAVIRREEGIGYLGGRVCIITEANEPTPVVEWKDPVKEGLLVQGSTCPMLSRYRCSSCPKSR